MGRTLSHYINGARVAGSSGRFGAVYDPATGAVAARVPLASAAETATAVAAAVAAFPAWRDTPPLRRAAVLFRFKELLERHLDELAQLVAAEHGKVLNDARGSVTRGIEVVEFACGAPHLLKGSFSEQVGSNVDSHSLRQPLGVCASGSRRSGSTRWRRWRRPTMRRWWGRSGPGRDRGCEAGRASRDPTRPSPEAAFCTRTRQSSASSLPSRI